jgi:hypothetical protein
MEVATRKPGAKFSKEANPQSFIVNEPAQSWETWHKRFGHIGYSGLQHMLDKNLVEGFTVNTRTQNLIVSLVPRLNNLWNPLIKSKRETEPGRSNPYGFMGKI